MSYFTRVTLEPARIDAAHLARLVCGEGYGDHQFVWRLLSDHDTEHRDFLFRREQRGGVLCFYVVSEREPPAGTGPWRVESKPYTPQLHKGETLAFTLRVNPVVTRKNGSGRVQRHDVVMDTKKRLGYDALPLAQRLDNYQLIQQAGWSWLESRAAAHGFEVEQDAVRIDAYRRIVAPTRRGVQPIRYSTLDYTGVLTVVDEERFTQTLLQGIGPAKAFGCGLMLVRRII
jgi:CRISPR system Cascade subunit CasE